jgi:cytochrome b pre-mRNA-processing protein 3
MLKAWAASSNGTARSPAAPSVRLSKVGFIATVTATALLVTTAGYWWLADDEGREIRALPVAQRQGLYQRTMENLKTICDPAPGRSVREFCRNQAGFALKFPECDDDCRRVARRHLSLPRP